MGRSSKSAKQKQPNNPNVKLRRSPRFADHFEKLPDELILTIFSKIDDSKTLIRCYSVSKRFASAVSTTRTVYLRLLYPTNDDPNCAQSHTPISAMTGFMKIFANLEHLKVKFCLSSSNPKRFSPFIFMLKLNPVIKITSVVQLGCLFTSELKMPLRRLEFESLIGERDVGDLEMEIFLLQNILPHFPKSLRSLVAYSPDGWDSGSGSGSATGGSVFLTEGQMRNLISSSYLYEDWLRNSENVLYWLEKTDRKSPLYVRLWSCSSREISTGKWLRVQMDKEELLDVLGDDF